MRHKQFHQGVEIHTWAILLFTEEKACDFDSLRWAGQGVGLGREGQWAGQRVPHIGLLICTSMSVVDRNGGGVPVMKCQLFKLPLHVATVLLWTFCLMKYFFVLIVFDCAGGLLGS